ELEDERAAPLRQLHLALLQRVQLVPRLDVAHAHEHEQHERANDERDAGDAREERAYVAPGLLRAARRHALAAALEAALERALERALVAALERPHDDTLSATRSFALRARGFLAISSSPATTGRLVRRRSG